jgi:hypothetical protein
MRNRLVTLICVQGVGSGRPTPEASTKAADVGGLTRNARRPATIAWVGVVSCERPVRHHREHRDRRFFKMLRLAEASDYIAGRKLPALDIFHTSRKRGSSLPSSNSPGRRAG